MSPSIIDSDTDSDSDLKGRADPAHSPYLPDIPYRESFRERIFGIDDIGA